ncbi:hypothetical protein T440DRAFT_367401, partial [Plenodomus tracheiphilus IPT5]
ADWAYLPNQGDFLYSVTSDGKLVRWDRTTNAWSLVQNYASIPTGGNTTTFGGLYAGSNGTLYGSENSSGAIVAFPVAGGNATRSSVGPTSSGNDGARCV